MHGQRRGLALLLAGLSLSILVWGCKKPEAAAPGPESPEKAAAPSPGEPAPTSPKAGAELAAQVTLRIGGPKSLRNPRGVTVDAAFNVYVVDTGNSRVIKFDPSGKQLLIIGGKGTHTGQFLQPVFAAFSPKSELLVLDSETSWIQFFSQAGKYLTRQGGSDLGFYHPAALAVLPTGSLAVVDTGGNRVVRVGADGKLEGDPLVAFGKRPFEQPSDIYADPKGGIHVYQAGAPSLYVHFSPTGELTGKWVAPDGISTLDTPHAVLAADGRVWATDPKNRQVRVYDADGATYHVVRAQGEDAVVFENPSGIALDARGRVYLVDAGASIIYRLEPPAAPAAKS